MGLVYKHCWIENFRSTCSTITQRKARCPAHTVLSKIYVYFETLASFCRCKKCGNVSLEYCGSLRPERLFPILGEAGRSS